MNDIQIENLIHKYQHIYNMCYRVGSSDREVIAVFREICFDIRMEEEFGES